MASKVGNPWDLAKVDSSHEVNGTNRTATHDRPPTTAQNAQK